MEAKGERSKGALEPQVLPDKGREMLCPGGGEKKRISAPPPSVRSLALTGEGATMQPPRLSAHRRGEKSQPLGGPTSPTESQAAEGKTFLASA